MPLNHTAALLTIASPNFDPLVRFYCQLLDREPTTFIPNVYAEFELSGMRLGIFRPRSPLSTFEVGSVASEAAGNNFKTPYSPLPTLGFGLCLEVENLEAAIAHLKSLGYPSSSEIMIASHGREIYAYDPDGNWLILHELPNH